MAASNSGLSPQNVLRIVDTTAIACKQNPEALAHLFFLDAIAVVFTKAREAQEKIHSLPQSSRNSFSAPINTNPDNKEATTLFQEILFNPVMADSIEHIHIFSPHGYFL